eukprot:2355696-Rhodomonas_salina.3
MGVGGTRREWGWILRNSRLREHEQRNLNLFNAARTAKKAINHKWQRVNAAVSGCSLVSVSTQHPAARGGTRVPGYLVPCTRGSSTMKSQSVSSRAARYKEYGAALRAPSPGPKSFVWERPFLQRRGQRSWWAGRDLRRLREYALHWNT